MTDVILSRPAPISARSFRLPNDVRTDGISASVKHGVLTVEVPKATKAEIPVREIPVAE